MRLTALNLAAVVTIVAVDWITPAGIVVGILLGIPIMLASFSDAPRTIWLTFAVAFVGFLAAAVLGRGPISPASVWIPNRIFVVLTLPAACVIALRIQSQRLQVTRAREDEARSGDLNRLLMSLLAHDLRSPLSMAAEAIEYVDGELAAGGRPDEKILADVETRLRRGLVKLDSILNLAKTEIETPSVALALRAGREIAIELASDLQGFAAEAGARGKVLEVEVTGDDRAYPADLLVIRQAAAILVDNAIRHTKPGTVRVVGRIGEGETRLTVTDPGPVAGGGERRGSSGLGLDLCRALVLRAGGTITQRRSDDGGSVLSVRLPLTGPPDRSPA